MQVCINFQKAGVRKDGSHYVADVKALTDAQLTSISYEGLERVALNAKFRYTDNGGKVGKACRLHFATSDIRNLLEAMENHVGGDPLKGKIVATQPIVQVLANKRKYEKVENVEMVYLWKPSDEEILFVDKGRGILIWVRKVDLEGVSVMPPAPADIREARSESIEDIFAALGI